MSTFSQWNGPGDIPGDLTIFYHRLCELEKVIAQFIKDTEEQLKLFQETAETLPTKEEFEEKMADIKKTIDDWLTDNADMIKALTEFTIIEDPEGLETVHNLKVKDGFALYASTIDFPCLYYKNLNTWVLAMKTWIFEAERIIFNQLLVFSGISFRSKEAPDDAIFGKDDNTEPITTLPYGTTAPTLKSKMTSAKALVMGKWYCLGVFDAGELGANVNSDYGAATFYFVVRDTVVCSAVVHAVASWHSNSTNHGALSATYTYSVQGGSMGDSTSGSRIEFDILEGTSANGKKCFIPVVSVNGQTGAIGNVWFVGRNVRRFKNGDNATVSLCNIKSEHGDGEGGSCHGNLSTGLRADDFSAQTVEVFYDHPPDWADALAALKVEGSFESTGKGTVNSKGSSGVVGLKVVGKIEADGLQLPASTDLTIRNLTVTGNSQQNGPVNMGSTLNVAGKTTLNGGADVNGNLKVTGTATTGAITATGDITTNGKITQTDVTKPAVLGAVTAASLHSNGALEAPNATVFDLSKADATFKNLNVTGNMAVQGNFKTDKIVGSNDQTWLERQSGKIVLGNKNQPLELNTNNNTPRINVVDGTKTRSLVYADELASGTLFQQGVTVTGTGAPGNLTSIVMETDITYIFEVGDTYLQQGGLGNPGPASTVALWKCTANDGTTATWVQDSVYDNPTKNGDHYMTFMWFGFALQNDGKYGNSYIFWNPNISPAWSIADLHMEGYRMAFQQDKLDGVLGAIGTIQPNWIDDDPVMNTPSPVPPNVPSTIPNPAYIQNKPWLGLTILNGGDLDDQSALDFQCIVDGGDLDQINQDLISSVPSTGQPVRDQLIKNGIIKIAHGTTEAGMRAILPPSAVTAFQLVYCADEKKLFIDTGNDYVLLCTGV